MLNLTVEKPALPTIWLDTSVIIKFTKIQIGEVISSEDQDRYGKLMAVLRQRAQQGRILCPEGDQSEEFEGKRLDGDVLRTLDELSLGVSFVHRLGIFDSQAQHGLRAFIQSAKEVSIPLGCFFRREPVQELKERVESKFTVRAHLRLPKDLLDSAESARMLVAEEVEKLRNANREHKKTYQAQLEEEKKAYRETSEYMVERFREKAAKGTGSLNDFLGVQGYLVLLAIWKRSGGDPPTADGLRKFLDSEYFLDLPINSIKSRLHAELVTGDQIIQSGDSMDVEMLSAVIPTSHYVVTDRKMEARVKRLGIDREFRTEIYSIASADQLVAKLSS